MPFLTPIHKCDGVSLSKKLLAIILFTFTVSFKLFSVEVPEGLQGEALNQWLEQTFPGADSYSFMSREVSQLIEQRARRCHSHPTAAQRQSCYEERFRGNGTFARQKYRQATRRTHPAIRSVIMSQCFRGDMANAHLLKKRRCVGEWTRTITRQVENIANQRGPNAITSDNFATAMGQELGQSPRSWYAEVYHSECRNQRNYQCFRGKMQRIMEEMRRANRDMQASLNAIHYNTAYMYLCHHQEQQARYCSDNAWISDYLNPPADDRSVLSYDPISTDELHRGIPSLYEGEDDFDADSLLTCYFGYNAKPDSERNMTAAEVCSQIRGTDLIPFSMELTHIMARTTVTTYFDALRIEAVSRFMRAHYELTGRHLPENPPHCTPFADGMDRFRATVPQGAHERYNQTTTSNFKAELKRAAVRVQDLVREARVKEAVPHYLGMGRERTLNPAYQPAQRRLNEIRQELLGHYTAFPYLSAGHDPRSEPYEDIPFIDRLANADDAAFEGVVAEARNQVSADLAASIDNFCNREQTPWPELIALSEITGPVTSQFPQFAFVQQCASEISQRNERSKFIASMFAAAGCTLGAFASAGVVGPLCAVGFTVVAAKQFNDAREQAMWVGRCRAAGNSVCNAEDYMRARGEYETALNELVLSGVFMAIEMPATLRLLRTIGNSLRPSQLRQLANNIRAAKSISNPQVARATLNTLEEEAEAMARASGMRSIASAADDGPLNFARIPENIRETVRNRVLRLEELGIPRSRIREVIPCLR